MSSTVGNISACQRPTVTATAVRSALARPKRSVSYGSRAKARTTRSPEICSRSTRLTPSTRTCMARNPGTIRETISPTDRHSAGTLTASSHESPTSSRTAMSTPPTIMIGAATSIVQVVSTSICTCWTSFVVRVMSDGAPKPATSRAENEPTWVNSSLRRSRPTLIAVRAPYQTAATVQTTCSSETPSMTAPVRRTYAVSARATPSSMMSAFRLGR